MLHLISMFGALCLFVCGLFLTAQGTFIEDFIRYLHLGSVIDFIISNNPLLLSLSFILFIVYWVRDWRWLLGIFIATFITLVILL